MTDGQTELELSRALGKLNRLIASPAPAGAELARRIVEVAGYNRADDPLALNSLRHALEKLANLHYGKAVLGAVEISNAAQRPSKTHDLAQSCWLQMMQGQGSAMFSLVEQSFNLVEDEGFKKLIGEKILEIASGGGGGSIGARRKALSAVQAFAESAGNGEIAQEASAALTFLAPK